MDDSEVKELLKFAFEKAQDATELKAPFGPKFTLAADLEGQKRDIQQLVAIAHFFTEWPFALREWAFTTLRDLARHYREGDPVDVPVEIYIWGLGVACGDIQPPKRPQGRDRFNYIVRNHAVGEMVAWLRRECGYTRGAAVAQVGAALLPKPLSCEAVETILRNLSKKNKYPPIC